MIIIYREMVAPGRGKDILFDLNSRDKNYLS